MQTLPLSLSIYLPLSHVYTHACLVDIFVGTIHRLMFFKLYRMFILSPYTDPISKPTITENFLPFYFCKKNNNKKKKTYSIINKLVSSWSPHSYMSHYNLYFLPL